MDFGFEMQSRRMLSSWHLRRALHLMQGRGGLRDSRKKCQLLCHVSELNEQSFGGTYQHLERSFIHLASSTIVKKTDSGLLCNERENLPQGPASPLPLTSKFCSKVTASKAQDVSNDAKLRNNIEASDSSTKQLMFENFCLYEDFLTEEEEDSLYNEVQPYLRKLRYEIDHWDDAIKGYRETERQKWNEGNTAILQRVRDLAFPPGTPQIHHVHVLDLQKTGYIKAHVDSIRFCGNTIAGMCLLSSSVMRLVHDKNKGSWANVLLKRRSLYIMKDRCRYEYTHEILPEEESTFRGEIIPRDRRISVICRNEPDPEDTESPEK